MIEMDFIYLFIYKTRFFFKKKKKKTFLKNKIQIKQCKIKNINHQQKLLFIIYLLCSRFFYFYFKSFFFFLKQNHNTQSINQIQSNK